MFNHSPNNLQHQLLLMVGLVITLTCPNAAQAQAYKLDNSHIAEDTFMVATLNVRHLRQCEKKDSKLIKRIASIVKYELGFELEELNEFQFALGGTGEGDKRDSFAAKMVFSKPIKLEQIVKKMFSGLDLEPAEQDGKQYFRPVSRLQPGLYLNKDNTVVIATEVRLLKLIEAKNADSVFADKLRKADGDTDFFFTFKNNEGFDKILGEFLDVTDNEFGGQLSKLPFDLKDIISEAVEGQLVINLDTAEPIRLQLTAKDKAGAERLKRAGDAWVALGTIGISKCKPHAKEFLENQATPAEMIKTVLNIIEKTEAVLLATDISVAEKKVVAKVELMGGLTSLLRDAVNTIMFFEFSNHEHGHDHHDHDHGDEGRAEPEGERGDIIEIPFDD